MTKINCKGKEQMKEKSNSIQALRALSCLCVFVYHCFSKTTVYWGVSVFFYLSGFLLVYRHINNGFCSRTGLKQSFSFAWGRMKKLYPLYIISILPILALEMYTYFNGLSGGTISKILKKLLACILMVQSWIPNNHYVFAYNGIGWYVSSAFFTYLIFPYILRRIRNYKSKRSPYVAVCAIFALMLALGFAAPALARLESRLNIPSDDSFEMWFTYNFPPFRALEFAIGCNLGCIFANSEKKASEKAVKTIDILCVILFFAAWYIYKFTDCVFAGEAFKYSQLFAPFCVVFLCAFVINRGVIAHIFTNPFTVFLGNLSGWFFILHMDVMKYYHIFMEYFGASTKLINILIVPIVGGITVGLSMIYDAIIKNMKHV